MAQTEPTGLNTEILDSVQSTRHEAIAKSVVQEARINPEPQAVASMFDKFLADAILEAAEGKIASKSGHVFSPDELTDGLFNFSESVNKAIKAGDQSLMADALLDIPSAGGLRKGIDTLLMSPQAHQVLEAIARLRTPEVEKRIGTEEKIGEQAVEEVVEIESAEAIDEHAGLFNPTELKEAAQRVVGGEVVSSEKTPQDFQKEILGLPIELQRSITDYKNQRYFADSDQAANGFTRDGQEARQRANNLLSGLPSSARELAQRSYELEHPR